jgi:RNA polymerase sigma-70 factor (ECF subfamily)
MAVDAEPSTRRAESTESEAELVDRLRRHGDRAAFAALYASSRRVVFTVCLHFLRDAAWAEDACHDVFVHAWERRSTLRGDCFTAWVRAMAARHSLNLLRHRSVRRRLDPEVPSPGSMPAVERAVAARQELEQAVEVLGSLPPEQRRVFLLRHVEGLGYEEIAEVTGYDAGRVRSTLQNARRNFRLGWEARVTGSRAQALARTADAHG